MKLKKRIIFNNGLFIGWLKNCNKSIIIKNCPSFSYKQIIKVEKTLDAANSNKLLT